MSIKKIYLRFIALFGGSLSLLLSNQSLALQNDQTDLTISRIRAVGDYAGETYDGTPELWFSTPLQWPSHFPCTATYVAVIDKKHHHLISAAYMAFTSGKKINIHVDTDLPIRTGVCEISFIDILN